LQAQISAAEFNSWQNYLSFGTFLERLLDRHLATVEALLYNAHRRKNACAREPQDFLLLAQPPRPQPTGDDLFSKMMAITLAHGGTVIDKRGRKD
jgi:hypothetical protein